MVRARRSVAPVIPLPGPSVQEKKRKREEKKGGSPVVKTRVEKRSSSRPPRSLSATAIVAPFTNGHHLVNGAAAAAAPEVLSAEKEVMPVKKRKAFVQQMPPPPQASDRKGSGFKRPAPDVIAAAVRDPANVAAHSKRVKLDVRHSERGSGVVLAFGTGDTGQLGLGPDILERKRPALVKTLQDIPIVDIVAGGMFTICLASTGEVYSFGCNDEGALGRAIEDDDEGMTPGKVDFPVGSGRMVQISAGDCHAAALSEDGQAYLWGTFRDSRGTFGLTKEDEIRKVPMPIAEKIGVKKISSGTDHLALLSLDGSLYTQGCGEQGQLGRVAERFTGNRGGRRGARLLLEPARVRAKNRSIVFTDVWAGSYNTLARTASNEILVCGLNNYSQMGIAHGGMYYSMVKSESFSSHSWRQIALGQHHTLGLDTSGKVYALGRSDYGRLGLGRPVPAVDCVDVPTLVEGMAGRNVVDVSAGTAVSFAVTDDGKAFSWGMVTNGQLGQEDDEEDAWSPDDVQGKQLESRRVIASAGGGQHTVLLARDN